MLAMKALSKLGQKSRVLHAIPRAQASTVGDLLFNRDTVAHESVTVKSKKVTIVGAGAVGVAGAFAILNQGLCSELTLVDIAKERAEGEAADLMHGSAFAKRIKVTGGSDFGLSAGSDLIIVTSGARQREGESRLALVGRNVDIFRSMIPQLVAANPGQPPMCIVSNPCDIMTQAAANITGWPAGRVFGSGTALDTSRFKTLIGDRLNVDPRSVHGFILGEHGDSSVAQWSGVSVGGVSLRALAPGLGLPGDPDMWSQVHKDVINAAYNIIKAKGYTNLAIGMTMAAIAEAVLRNDRRVMPLSVHAQGLLTGPGIGHDVYMSLPAVLGKKGVSAVLRPTLTSEESSALDRSADAILKTKAAVVNFP